MAIHQIFCRLQQLIRNFFPLPQAVNPRHVLCDFRQAFLIVLDGAHLLDRFDAGLHQKLQLVEPVAFLIISLNFQIADGFDRRRHAFMAGKQNDKQILIKAADLFHDLVAADRCHQKVQEQNVIMAVSHPLNGFVGIVFYVYVIAGTLKIGLQR